MKIPKLIRPFVDTFSKFPGIGPRQAIRLAFYMIGQGVGAQDEVIRILKDLKNVKACKQCFYIHENKSGLCEFCEDGHRDQSVIAVVEKETDVLSIENTGKFNGRYLVLGDIRKTGILGTDQKLRLQSLKKWIEKEEKGKAKEIIVAINPTTEGDIIAGFITEDLKPYAKSVSRLGRGIPTGGEIEFADEDTLGDAIEGRS
jgi:recombination protein RecR